MHKTDNTIYVNWIIVTRNRQRLLYDNLRLMREKGVILPGDLVIIVDNSDDEKLIFRYAEKIRSYDINLQLLRNNAVNNPSKLRNFALRYANLDFIVFLDDDAILTNPLWRENLVLFRKNEKLAGFTGVLKEPGKDIISNAEGLLIGKITREGKVIGQFNIKPDSVIEVDHMRGCFMVFKTIVVKELGGFDERITGMFFEETELCLRAKKCGYIFYLIPDLVVEHAMHKRDGFIGRSEDRPVVYFYKIRNYYYSMSKNFKLSSLKFIFNDIKELKYKIGDYLRKRMLFKTFLWCCIFVFAVIVGLIMGFIYGNNYRC